MEVVGPGDEVFYWANNEILQGRYGYCCDYSSNQTNYVVNGYGTGYDTWVLGAKFSNGPTRLYSLDFGTAPGSRGPTYRVTVQGFVQGAMIWETSTDLFGQTTLLLPPVPIDRFEIVRVQSSDLPSNIRVGWYTLDNVTYEIPFAMASSLDGDGYAWKYYTEKEFFASGGGVPEPETYATMIIGFGILGSIVRRRRDRRSAFNF